MYQEKYDEFQQTLTKSSDVFQNFKDEMDRVLFAMMNTRYTFHAALIGEVLRFSL